MRSPSLSYWCVRPFSSRPTIWSAVCSSKPAKRIDAAYQPKLGEVFKGQEPLGVQGNLGHFELGRDYSQDAGKSQGHHPADAALGWEVG